MYYIKGCESCGHPIHHNATGGACCSAVVFDIESEPQQSWTCPCPSRPGPTGDCACKGSEPWRREHTETYCNDDYPQADPNRCQRFCWEALTTHWCRKRTGHTGVCRRFNDHECGEMALQTDPQKVVLCNRPERHDGKHSWEISPDIGAKISSFHPFCAEASGWDGGLRERLGL